MFYANKANNCIYSSFLSNIILSNYWKSHNKLLELDRVKLDSRKFSNS